MRSKSTWRKTAIATLVGCVLLLIASGASIVFLLRASLPQLDGDVLVSGLQSSVSIERDVHGVPTVRADNREDLALALGFLHAQDRFFQMDLMRRSAGGQLAELIGEPALKLDRVNRAHGFARLAGEILDRADGEARRLIEAYTAGVNAGLRALGARPFEYFLLNSEPEPWEAADSVLAIFAMYMRLNDHNASRDASRSVLRDVLPPELYEFLEPRGTRWDAPLEGSAIFPNGVPEQTVYDLRRAPRAEFAHLSREKSGRAPDVIGSNNWALAASRTAAGRAILANDMHLGLGVPNTWYRARLVMEGPGALDMTGVTLPGSFLIIAGSNGKIAWGFTNSYGDWVDLVLLELDPEDPGKYRTPRGFVAFTERREVLEVSGGEPETVIVRDTIWGPVWGEDHRGRPVALQWLAHHAEASNFVLYELEEAGDVASALDIANRTGIPPQNFLVADTHGSIGWTIMGRLPERRGYDSTIASTLSGAQQGWIGWVAPERYPRIIDPDIGQLWTANARVVSGAALAQIGEHDYPLGARAGQIRDRLATVHAGTIEDMLALQLDHRARFFDGWQAILLDLLSPEQLEGRPVRAEFRLLVENWNGYADVDSVGYRLVRDFRGALIERSFAALTAEARNQYPDAKLMPSFQFEGVVRSLLAEKPRHLLHPDYESWPAFMLSVVDELNRELKSEGGSLEDRSWGERNIVDISHPLSRALPVLARWLDMPAQALPGDVHMPRVQGRSFGASERFAVSPGAEEQGYFHMPAGQSGHPLSPFYSSGHDAWVHGEPTPFLPEETVHRLHLRTE